MSSVLGHRRCEAFEKRTTFAKRVGKVAPVCSREYRSRTFIESIASGNCRLVLCHRLMLGLCATASESSETQCLRYFHSHRRALLARRRSNSGTRSFSRDKALG